METKQNLPEDRAAKTGYETTRTLAARPVGRGTSPSVSQTPFESAQPRYLAVAERLSQAITQGEYGVGSLLPTESELCDKFGVSRHTVREALRKLRDLGLVTRHQGVGTRVENAEISADAPPTAERVPLWFELAPRIRGAERHVFIREENDPATQVTLSSTGGATAIEESQQSYGDAGWW